MDETETPEENGTDPFSDHNLAISQFILTARLYDVMFALLREARPDVARDLLELHGAGNLIGPQPSFNGVFITDEVNRENPYTDEEKSSEEVD